MTVCDSVRFSLHALLGAEAGAPSYDVIGSHAKRPNVIATWTKLISLTATELDTALEQAADVLAGALACEKANTFLS